MRTRQAKAILFLFAAFLFASCATPTPIATPAPTATPTPIPGERQEATVLRVVDGDTIVVDLDGKRYSVRYIGIDTPETHHPTSGADHLGLEATDANRELVKEGETVVLQRDISETDIYDRMLRYVWVGDTLVNAELVRMGLAQVKFYDPDVLYEAEIREAQAEARDAKRGVYGPKPTPPAKTPIVRQGDVWTVAPSGGAVGLRYDPGRGEPEKAYPADLKVCVVDAFWVPDEAQWWYWIGVNGFNGWVTGDAITRDAPSAEAEGPPAKLDAYDYGKTLEDSTLRRTPDAGGELAGSLGAGTPVQVKGLSWEPASGGWWFYLESTDGEGWVEVERVGQ